MFMDKAIEKLKGKGVVLTHQRLAVLRYFGDHPGDHPCASEIFRHLRQEYPTISLATVYSTLGLLRKVGQIRELSIRGHPSCFDVAEKPHYHLLCRQCGCVFDVDTPCPPLDEGRLQGHQVEEVELYLYGTCRSCLETEVPPA
jgi:Fur family peroxide stress response transcriptional regulator